MVGRAADPHAKIFRHLAAFNPLDDGDYIALTQLQLRSHLVRENRDIAEVGQHTSQCCVLLTGVACRYKTIDIGKGQRHILSLHFAGGILDLENLLLGCTDHAIRTLTPGEIAYVSHDRLRSVIGANASLAMAFVRQALIDACIAREWITNGRRGAIERICHLFCEYHDRLRAIGEAGPDRFALGLTQQQLAEATGLSVVHLNRTLQALRKSGTIITRGNMIIVPDFGKLRSIAHYDAAYLYLNEPARS